MQAFQTTFRPVVTALFSAGLALFSLNAAADTGYLVRTEVSPITITVIDLTPNDGKAAGFTTYFADNEIGGYGAAGKLHKENHTAGASDALFLELGTAYVKRSYGPATGQFVNEMALRSGPPGSPSKQLLGETDQSLSYTVLPNTELRFSGTAALSIARTGDLFGSSSYASASTIVKIAQWNIDDNGVFTLLFEDQVSADRRVTETDSSVSTTENFELVFRNDKQWAQELQFYGGTTEQVYFDATSPVPEPATYGMLGAGMLLVGAAARSRRRRQG